MGATGSSGSSVKWVSVFGCGTWYKAQVAPSVSSHLELEAQSLCSVRETGKDDNGFLNICASHSETAFVTLHHPAACFLQWSW